MRSLRCPLLRLASLRDEDVSVRFSVAVSASADPAFFATSISQSASGSPSGPSTTSFDSAEPVEESEPTVAEPTVVSVSLLALSFDVSPVEVVEVS